MSAILEYNFTLHIVKGSHIILNTQTLLQQFRTFYKENNPNNFEEAIEKFAVFGGVAWENIDTSKQTYTLIEKMILPDFRYIRNDITELTTGMPLYHSILTGIAMGDGKTHTAYKRANISKEVGDKAIEELCEIGIIKLEKSKKVFTSWAEEDGEKISHKLFFTSPFLRFWFAFVSPLFKGVRDRDFKEVKERFANRQSEFLQLTFAQLAHELLKINVQEDPIKEIGTYWDNEMELDIYGKTASGKTIAGISKYTNSKMKKSALTKLQEDCKKVKIEADIFVLVSKNGFSNELKSLKGKELQLLSLKNFKKLL